MIREKRAAFYTLGCKLNFSETSTISRQLSKNGFSVTNFNNKADVYVINTCSVTENANKECRRVIRKAKITNPQAVIAVTGCYAQLKPKEISNIEGVDLVLGANEKFNLPNLINNINKSSSRKIHGCEINNLDFIHSYSMYDRTRSFLKIQDGCDYPCTYCTIPLARGRSRSGTIKKIIKNAEDIANNGVKEIVLTGVNIGDFKDGNFRFIDVIKELDQLKQIDRFRISSIEPNLISSEIIDFVSSSDKFVPHFHIPMQSGSNNILRNMKRRYKIELYQEKIKEITKKINDVCIGADVIVGFPGETNEEFLKTMNIIKELPLSYLHVFPYSERENTNAINLKNKIDNRIKSERVKQLIILSEKLKTKFYNKFQNSIKEVLFEKVNKNGMMYGFTDNYIKTKVPFNEKVKDITKVKLGMIDNDGIMTANLI